MSEQERKKMLSKQRKAQKKAAQKQQQLQSGQDKDTGKRGVVSVYTCVCVSIVPYAFMLNCMYGCRDR